MWNIDDAQEKFIKKKNTGINKGEGISKGSWW